MNDFRLVAGGLMNQLVKDVAAVARPVKASSLIDLASALSTARIVMLGEATHGTAEFYRLRQFLTQRLIEDHGFRFVAVEGDWPDCQRINRFIFQNEGHSARDVLAGFRRWPTWMWANEETVGLVDSLRENETAFYGLDIYSLFESIEAIRRSLKHFDAFLAARVEERYACFDRFGRDETLYARSFSRLPDSCHQQVIANLRELLRLRLHDIQLNESELLDIQQNARIIANAEHYYRAMMGGETLSWDVRDHHMMDTLEHLLRRAGPDARAVVWAHNTHIGDYHATDMPLEGSVNLGGLAREKFGPENIALVGFGTYEGKVSAGFSWGAPVHAMMLPAARADSWEGVFHAVAQAQSLSSFILNLKPDGGLRAKEGMRRESRLFDQRLGHRAVGVVYDPRFELHGRNYVPTHLSQRYDHFIFVDRTTALQPLQTVIQQGLIPETWPAGL